MIATARFETKPEKLLIGLNTITIHRGELRASQRYLAKRWERSTNWVNKCMKLFKNESMIDTRKEQGETIIIMLNYNKFNPIGGTVKNSKRNAVGNAVGNAVESQKNHSEEQTKEGKEREEDLYI